jgi:predicted glycoside hydrolase/deacetylase ChbG (UPF0249 family)
MSRCLVVNADDFGRTPGVTRGIVDAHLQGIVTSTTVMSNLPGATRAVDLARREAPQLAMGIHLNLTHGRPLLPPAQVPSLVDASGSFHPYTELCRRIVDVDPGQVRIEWQAQIDALQDTGAAPDHLDSHHFVAELTPQLWTIYLELARAHGLAVRGPRPPKVGHQQIVPPTEAPPQVDFDAARGELRASGVPSSDGLRVDFFGEDANQKLMLSLLSGLPEGVTELMTHPGHVDEDLLSSSGYAQQREAELSVLTSKETLQAVADGGIYLARYAEALLE